MGRVELYISVDHRAEGSIFFTATWRPESLLFWKTYKQQCEKFEGRNIVVYFDQRYEDITKEVQLKLIVAYIRRNCPELLTDGNV